MSYKFKSGEMINKYGVRVWRIFVHMWYKGEEYGTGYEIKSDDIKDRRLVLTAKTDLRKAMEDIKHENE